MDGGKIEWIRKDLGMSWVEFHRELGISRMTLWRCRQEGAPKLISLAVLGLWYSKKWEVFWSNQVKSSQLRQLGERRIQRRRSKRNCPGAVSTPGFFLARTY